MFDIGWQELFVIAVVTVIVIGPKELPRVLRTASLWIRKIKDMARDFQDGIHDLAREAELDEIRKEIEAGKLEIDREIEAGKREIDIDLEKTIDPTGEIGGSIREIGDAAKGKDGSEPKTLSAASLTQAETARGERDKRDTDKDIDVPSSEAPAKDRANG